MVHCHEDWKSRLTYKNTHISEGCHHDEYQLRCRRLWEKLFICPCLWRSRDLPDHKAAEKPRHRPGLRQRSPYRSHCRQRIYGDRDRWLRRNAPTGQKRTSRIKLYQRERFLLPSGWKSRYCFSNAVFHWIGGKNQQAMLSNIYYSLKPGGELVCEFGSSGCVEAVHGTLEPNVCE